MHSTMFAAKWYALASTIRQHCANSRRKLSAQNGSALIIVLWASLLISAILVGTIATVKLDAKIAVLETENLKAHEAARAALEVTAFNIATNNNNRNATPKLEPITLNGYVVSIAPSPDSQKIDINLASEILLWEFFAMLGEDNQCSISCYQNR